jgi:hypothetical protein
MLVLEQADELGQARRLLGDQLAHLLATQCLIHTTLVYALRATVLRVVSDPRNLAALRADPEKPILVYALRATVLRVVSDPRNLAALRAGPEKPILVYALRATVLRVVSDPRNLAALRADPEKAIHL